jgi:hypothetical protein
VAFGRDGRINIRIKIKESGRSKKEINEILNEGNTQ